MDIEFQPDESFRRRKTKISSTERMHLSKIGPANLQLAVSQMQFPRWEQYHKEAHHLYTRKHPLPLPFNYKVSMYSEDMYRGLVVISCTTPNTLKVLDELFHASAAAPSTISTRRRCNAWCRRYDMAEMNHTTRQLRAARNHRGFHRWRVWRRIPFTLFIIYDSTRYL